MFTHYNDMRALIDTFSIDAYDDSPPSLSLKGYINTKVCYTFVSHFDSRGSSTTLVWTSTSTAMTTPSMIEDSVTSTGQEGLGDHTRGLATPEADNLCSVFMREDLEASQ